MDKAITLQTKRFRPGWRMSLFTLLLLPLVLCLGVWQLDRADEKRQFEETYLERIGALAKPPGDRVAAFERIRLTGEYEAAHYFLLDNQTHNGAVGFTVISSFRADDGRRWLINRGFVPGDRARRSRPEVVSPEGPITLVGLAWPELGMLPVFGEDAWTSGWPKLVQRLEVARMAALLENAQPQEIRLEAGQPGVFVPPPLELNMPATKHTGYAVQWFGLGVALGIGFLVFGFRRT